MHTFWNFEKSFHLFVDNFNENHFLEKVGIGPRDYGPSVTEIF